MEPLPKDVIVAAALQLSPETWCVLFELLLGDFEVEPDPEIEAAWLEVAERRLREMEEGQVEWISAEEVFAKVREMATRPVPPRPPVRVGERLLPVAEVMSACLVLPVAERVSLAGHYLGQLRERQEGTSNARWVEESERWLARARAALG